MITVTECRILEVLTDLLFEEDVWISLSKLYIISYTLYYSILFYTILILPYIYIVDSGIKSWYTSSASTTVGAAAACRYGEVLFSNRPSTNQQGEGQNYEGEIPFLTRLLDIIFRYVLMINTLYYCINSTNFYFMHHCTLYLVASMI